MTRTCPDFRELISASLDLRVDAADARALEDHLAACPACRAAHDEMATADALLRPRPEAPLPAGFADRVLRDARARRWPGFAAAGALAAALLATLALSVTTPPDPEPAKARVAEHLGAMATFAGGVSAASAEPPDHHLAFAREEARLLELRARTEALKKSMRWLSAGDDLRTYVAATEKMLDCVERGDVASLRDATLRREVAEKARRLEQALGVRASTPAVSQSVRREAPAEVQSLVRGHVALAAGRYDEAVRELSTSPGAAHTLLLAEAYRKRGAVDDALVRYLTASRAACAEGTSAYAAQALKVLGTERDLYVNNRKVRDSSVEDLTRALSDRDVSLAYADRGQCTVLGDVRHEAFKALSKIRGARTESRREGVSSATVTLAELDSAELERLREVAVLKAVLEGVGEKGK